MAVSDLAQPVVDRVLIRRQFQTAAHQFHGRAGADQGAGDEVERGLAAAVAREQIGEDDAGLGGLPAAEIVERNILRALQPAQRVPLGFAVANVVDRRHGTKPGG